MGIVTAGTLAKNYAPVWLYNLLFFGAILYVCIWMSIPKYKYWYFVYENDEDCNCGIIKSQTDVFPLDKAEKLLDSQKRGYVIKGSTEIDKTSYLHMISNKKAIDIETANQLKDRVKWN